MPRLIRGIAAALSIFAAFLTTNAYGQPHQLEYLDRGLVAVKASESEVYLSWRLLVSDPEYVGFNVYRASGGDPAVKLNMGLLRTTTDYVDTAVDFGVSNEYYVRPVVGGVELGASKTVTVSPDQAVQQYLSLPLEVPEGGTTPAGENFSYTANDLSVGDLDGDGRYEIVVKWSPTNAKDNAQAGYTGNTILDAYTLEGERLWRIDLGINIRSGAHYTQFMVYDLDGDGIAEVACRTAEGSMDASGNYVADESKWSGERPAIDHSADHRNTGENGLRPGMILKGPEFLTIFDGRTGNELASTMYVPQRHPDTLYPTTQQIDSIWGDNYGNRIDRFLAAVAYLDGERPSLVMCRGYYTRAALAAWDWRDGKLTQRWVFDTYGNPEYSAYRGEGAHSLTVGDVDGDGADEIVYGAATIDHDGTGLYATGLGHGDALHLSDMDPDRPGMEVWMPHECVSCYGENGSELHDAETGELIFGVSGEGTDVGRGVAADIDPRFRGYETWASRGGMHSIIGEPIETNGMPAMNFLVWWDADPLRELLDGTRISKWNSNLTQAETLLMDGGIVSVNGTKANPGLSADIYGDWREEVIWPTTDSSELRIYSTKIPANSRFTTLMHDRQYRLAIAWQNVGYNQPPHPSFFLGDGMDTPPKPDYFYNYSNTAPSVELVSPSDGSFFEEGDVVDLVAEASDEDGSVEVVEFFENSKFLGSDFSEPYTGLWDANEGGSYLLRAIATDEMGAQSLSLPVVVTVAHTVSYDESDGLIGWTEIGTSVEGYRGDGYLAFDRPWHFVEFRNLDGGLIGGTKTLKIRYSAGRPGVNPCFLIINGVRQTIQLPSTGSDENWQEYEIQVALDSGPVNTVRLQARGGAALIDEVLIAGVVRNQAPSIQLLSPQNGLQFPEGVDITIAADAEDIGGSVAAVEFFAGETLLGSDDTEPFSLVWPAVGEGVYSLTASATDDLGEVAVSPAAEILVNNPPSVEIVSPFSGAYVPSGEVFSIVADADDGVGVIEEVAFFLGETLLATDTEAPYSVDWSSEEEGQYTFSAVATDNRGATTLSQPVELIVSPAGYAATYQAEDADLSGEVVTESSNPGFNGTGYVNMPTEGGMLLFDAVDGGSGSMAILRIRYTLGAADSRTGSLTVNNETLDVEFPSTGGWSTYQTVDLPFPFDAGETNTVLIESTGEDLANIDEIAVLGLQDEADLTYHVENAYRENLPLETNNLGYNGTGFVNFPGEGGLLEFRELDGGIGGMVTLKIRYAMGAAGERTGTLSINGVQQPISFPSTGGWSTYQIIELDIELLAGPQNTLSIASIGNDLGNPDEIILSGITPNDIPEVTLLSPTDDDIPGDGRGDVGWLIGDPMVFTAEASDPDGSIQKVEYYARDARIKLGEATEPPYTFEWVVEGGTYEVWAEAVDNYGARGRSDGYTVDIQFDNSAPVVSIVSPADGSTGSKGEAVAIEVDASDEDGTVTRVEIYVDGVLYAEDTEAPYTAEWTPETEGSYTIEAVAIDNFGTASKMESAAYGVFYDTGGALAQEAEDGILVGSFTVIDDPEASSGQAVEAVSGPASENYVEFRFNVPEPGYYVLRTLEKSIDGSHDSMYVSVNGADPEQYTWFCARSNTFIEDYVNGGGQDPLELNLDSGAHFVRFGYRENMFLDSVELEFVRERPENYLPEVAISAPAPGSVYNEGESIEITATTSDVDGEVELVEFFANSEKVGEDTSSPFLFIWNGATGGTYDLTAVAWDDYGDSNASEPVSVSVLFPGGLSLQEAESATAAGFVFPTDDAEASGGQFMKFYDPANAGIVSGGVYQIVNLGSGHALEANGREAFQAALDGSDAQKWTITEVGEGAYGVVSVETGEGLDEYQGGSTNVGLWTFDGSKSNQQWSFTEDAGAYIVSSLISSDVLSIEGPLDDDGSNVYRTADTASDYQRWLVIPAGGGGSGPDANYLEFNFNVEEDETFNLLVTYRAPDENSNSVYVSVDGGPADEYLWNMPLTTGFESALVTPVGESDALELDFAAGAHTVRLGFSEPVDIDQVELVLDPDIGNGRTYQFINVGSGMALTSVSRSVYQSPSDASASQRWVVDEVSEGVYGILLEGTSEGLDHYVNDGIIGTWTFDASKSNQLFSIVEVEEGIYTVSPLSAEATVVIGIDGSSDVDGASIVPAEYAADASSDFQHWALSVLE